MREPKPNWSSTTPNRRIGNGNPAPKSRPEVGVAFYLSELESRKNTTKTTVFFGRPKNCFT
jgi:hypothetical protein